MQHKIPYTLVAEDLELTAMKEAGEGEAKNLRSRLFITLYIFKICLF